MPTNNFFMLVFAGLLFLCACKDPNPQEPLYQDEIDILQDVLLVESMLQDFTGNQRDSVAQVNYDLIYDRHGITEQGLQEMRKRFSEDPTLWNRAADSLVNLFQANRENFDQLLNAELK